AELLQQKQRRFDRTGRDTQLDFDDPRIRRKLRPTRRTLQSVPNKGQAVPLLDNANLSTGGDAVDVSETLHADHKKLAIAISRDMGLRMCGMDIMTRDATLPIDEYVVLEINSAPGLDNYASIGVDQRRKVDELYLKVLRAVEA